MKRTKIKEVLCTTPIGTYCCVKGWVKTKRVSKQMIFITLNDGSMLDSLQVVTEAHRFPAALLQRITTGASLCVEGTVMPSQGKAQALELQAEKLTVLGTAAGYPLQPKKHSFEFLRDLAQLRFRTHTFGAVFRIRHAISYAIHRFFHKRGFVYLHTPIITGIDAEGAGEMLTVTTLDMAHVPQQATGQVDFSQDFFGQRTYLTVSGQLAAEAAALGLAEVYTFGPTFRAEHSHTTRHLAEFWMVEPEVAFYDLAENIALAEELLKEVICFVLAHCQADLTWLEQRALTAKPAKQQAANSPLLERLHGIVAQPFARITYTEAITILKAAKPNKQGKFMYTVQEWGADLQAEHERYLVEQYFKKPVVITDYPKAIKAFYMRQNADEKTVAAMDILFPGIGEIIGGSQREERLEQLCAAIKDKHIAAERLQWYIDTRHFGSAPHSGFGLGLERLVQFVTGMDNIRDVIPFPRTPGNAAC